MISFAEAHFDALPVSHHLSRGRHLSTEDFPPDLGHLL